MSRSLIQWWKRVPETFVVNAQGHLLKHIVGTLTEYKQQFHDSLQEALKPS